MPNGNALGVCYRTVELEIKGYILQKPELFSGSKEFIGVSALLVLLLLIHLSFKYYTYQTFISKPFYYTYAEVLNAYSKKKNNRLYQVIKLHSDEGYTFYTTTHRRESFAHKRLRLQIFPDKGISFWDYLGTFYVKSKIKHQEKLPNTFKTSLEQNVASQHQESSLQQFYNAIFFATPLDADLREPIAKLGVSHLVALSGFHIGILWGLIYGLLLLLYSPLQQKYFPYRFALFDVGLVAMLLLGVYVWFVGYPASLLRAYAMVLVGWAVLLMGLELLSFHFLSIVILSLLVIFPSLLVSLGFWLSVAGVFYIFLLLRYFDTLNKWVVSFLVIPLGIFTLMLPVVHTIFGMTSTYQLLSPLLSILFVPFYPLAMLLHLLGLGGILDSVLLWLFHLPQESQEKLLPLWVMVGYIALSIGAIWQKRLFYVVVGLAFIYGMILFV